MKEINWLKDLYKPIQPTVKTKQQDISYIEYPPITTLQNIVYCYWHLTTTQSLKTTYQYRVVSDGCIDIFFNLDNPSESFVMGFCRKYTTFPLGTYFNYVGIRFFPSAFSQLFEVNAKTLSNTVTPLKEIVPDAAKYITKVILPTQTLPTLGPLLDQFFNEVLDNQHFDIDNRFYDALQLILKKKGNLDTETDLNTGISPRQLRRLFNLYLGTTPKAFSKVVRFQHILQATPSNQSLKKEKIYYDAGFYDQAHFIKDFKNFYGVTPMVAFQ